MIPRPEPITLYCLACDAEKPHVLLAQFQGKRAMCTECTSVQLRENAGVGDE